MHTTICFENKSNCKKTHLCYYLCNVLQATRDYCLGDAPTPSAVAAAAALGTQLATAVGAAVGTTESNATASATLFDPANDIVAADLVLVMDKYTAADVLREVRAGCGMLVVLSYGIAVVAACCVQLSQQIWCLLWISTQQQMS